ncbi:MAG: succinate dehydrogenase, cytochrome b556 subunit [Candidatus Promineifilaceae bacterium]|jgi:succinate dehydrogenase cytochrome b subunit
MASLTLTVREAIRYRGRSGQYSWIAHRLSGLAILSFLVIHVWDTANAYFAPHLYAWSLALFKNPLFALGEIGVMAAVLYHAMNGLRITLLDFKPEWWLYQGRSAIIVWILFFVIFIPIAILMFSGVVAHCSELAMEGMSCWAIPSLSDFPPGMFQ